MSDFLKVKDRTFLIFGVANRKSVAWFVAKALEEQGAKVLYSVRSETRRRSLSPLLDGKAVFLCDVEHEGAADQLAADAGPHGHRRCFAVNVCVV